MGVVIPIRLELSDGRALDLEAVFEEDVRGCGLSFLVMDVVSARKLGIVSGASLDEVAREVEGTLKFMEVGDFDVLCILPYMSPVRKLSLKTSDGEVVETEIVPIAICDVEERWRVPEPGERKPIKRPRVYITPLLLFHFGLEIRADPATGRYGLFRSNRKDEAVKIFL